MTCPFCQHELNTDTLACDRCGALYPVRGGMSFRFKVRTTLVGLFMLMLTAIFLQSCVITYINSDTVVSQCMLFTTGGNCAINSKTQYISQQSSQFGGPKLKSYDLQTMMLDWGQGIQPTQNNPYTTPNKKPTR